MGNKDEQPSLAMGMRRTRRFEFQSNLSFPHVQCARTCRFLFQKLKLAEIYVFDYELASVLVCQKEENRILHQFHVTLNAANDGPKRAL
jgi:hypothetical protein